MKPKLLLALSLLVIASLVLAACQPKATPTETQPPATEPPITESVFTPRVLEAPNCDYGGVFKRIAAIDEYTVVFELCRPDPAFLSKIAFSAFSIFPEEWIERTAGDGQRTLEGLEAPVGTGPFKLVKWNRGDSIVFEANPDYWGEKPAYKRLVFRWLTESAGRLLELQAGTVDGIDNVGPNDFDVVRNDPNLKLIERPALNVFYIGMTNTFKPFDDVRVRQALAMGIDRKRIVDNFYPAGSEVADFFTPCAIPNGCVGQPWYEFNPEKARALLAEAGYPNGFSTKLYYRDVVRGYLPEPGKVAEEIQAQLKQNLNINVEIVVMESGAFLDEATSGRLNGLYLLGWGADYPHVTNFLDYHFNPSNPQFGQQSPTYYEKLAEAAKIADPEKARPLYEAANNAIREFVPMIPVAHGGSGVAYRADVQGAHASPLGNENFAAVKPGSRDTFVWMQNAEPISLFCADETDGESLRACEQVLESLYAYEVGGVEVKPALAEKCEPNADLTVWTCTLRKGVKFHDGTRFDANDVVATFTMGLDASSPLHVGNTNAWEYYDYLWGLMNKK